MENSSPKILYAEDESITNLFISKYLKTCGEVFSAFDGEEAYKIFTQNDIDLLVTDISMPKMDGRMLIRKILEEYGQEKVEIIVTSAYREELSDLKDFVHVIEKPVNSESLMNLVRKILK